MRLIAIKYFNRLTALVKNDLTIHIIVVHKSRGINPLRQKIHRDTIDPKSPMSKRLKALLGTQHIALTAPGRSVPVHKSITTHRLVCHYASDDAPWQANAYVLSLSLCFDFWWINTHHLVPQTHSRPFTYPFTQSVVSGENWPNGIWIGSVGQWEC